MPHEDGARTVRRSSAQVQASAPPAGSFVSDVTHAFEVEFVRVAKLLVLAIAEKTALSRIFGLRTRRILLVPPELRAPAKLRAPS
jgi:hypothetical protein